jgi:CDP-diacylglycerol--glycerol-3-phosphate 3-phosphatidyltransferase
VIYVACLRGALAWPILAAAVLLTPFGSSIGMEWRRRPWPRVGGRSLSSPSLNIPNAITLGRMALVPLVVVAMVDARRGGSPALAAGLFGVLAASDALDGHLARARHDITNFGKLVDPIADKVLVGAALVVLVGQERVAAWVAVAVIVREVAVTGMRVYAGRRGVVISASALGKRKTLVQIAAVLTLILAPDPGAWWVLAIVYAAVLMTVVSGVEYFAALKQHLVQPPSPEDGPQADHPPELPSPQTSTRLTADSPASSPRTASRQVPRR